MFKNLFDRFRRTAPATVAAALSAPVAPVTQKDYLPPEKPTLFRKIKDKIKRPAPLGVEEIRAMREMSAATRGRKRKYRLQCFRYARLLHKEHHGSLRRDQKTKPINRKKHRSLRRQRAGYLPEDRRPRRGEALRYLRTDGCPVFRIGSLRYQ